MGDKDDGKEVEEKPKISLAYSGVKPNKKITVALSPRSSPEKINLFGKEEKAKFPLAEKNEPDSTMAFSPEDFLPKEAFSKHERENETDTIALPVGEFLPDLPPTQENKENETDTIALPVGEFLPDLPPTQEGKENETDTIVLPPRKFLSEEPSTEENSEANKTLALPPEDILSGKIFQTENVDDEKLKEIVSEKKENATIALPPEEFLPEHFILPKMPKKIDVRLQNDVKIRAVKTRKLKPATPGDFKKKRALETRRLEPLAPSEEIRVETHRRRLGPLNPGNKSKQKTQRQKFPLSGSIAKDKNTATQRRKGLATPKRDEKAHGTKKRKALSTRFVKEDSELTREEENLALIEMMRNVLQRIIFSLKKISPKFDLITIFMRALNMLEVELKKSSDGTDVYWLLYDKTREDITNLVNNPAGGKEWNLELKTKEHLLLAEQPCNTFYFFLRLLALLLYCCKNKLEKEFKIVFAKTILQTLNSVPHFTLRGERKICELDSIFQYCRKHELKADFSPCQCASCIKKFEEDR